MLSCTYVSCSCLHYVCRCVFLYFCQKLLFTLCIPMFSYVLLSEVHVCIMYTHVFSCTFVRRSCLRYVYSCVFLYFCRTFMFSSYILAYFLVLLSLIHVCLLYTDNFSIFILSEVCDHSVYTDVFSSTLNQIFMF